MLPSQHGMQELHLSHSTAQPHLIEMSFFYLICRTVSPSSPVWIRKQLYVSLVQPHLAYCSQLWRPVLVKDIQSLKQLQRGATKYILQDYSLDYKSRLVSLNWLELQDLTFLWNLSNTHQILTMLPCFLQHMVHHCPKTMPQIPSNIYNLLLLLQQDC